MKLRRHTENEHAPWSRWIKSFRFLLLFCFFCYLPLGGQSVEPSTDLARSVLKKGLDAKDPDERIQAIQASGLIGMEGTLQAQLEEALGDENVNVRVAAINTLVDLKSTGSIPAIRERLREDKAPEVTFAAAKALYAMHDESGQMALYEVYAWQEKAESDVLHVNARKFMNNFHSMESAGMFVISTGVGYVPVPGVGEGFSALMGLVSDSDLSPRATALLLLARKKNDWTTDLLKNALQDSDWSVRASAVQLIAYGARSELRGNLVPLFIDKDQRVRFRAASAYLHLALAKDAHERAAIAEGSLEACPRVDKPGSGEMQ
jgi:HEAT repeat protein